MCPAEKSSAIVRIIFLVVITLVIICVKPVRAAANIGAPALSAKAIAFPIEEEHGLSEKAEEIGRVGNFPITNSMIVSWIVALTLIIFVQFATRNMKPIPSG